MKFKYCLMLGLFSYITAEANNQVSVVPIKRDTVKINQLKDVIVSTKSTEGQILHVDLHRVPVNSSQDLLRKIPGLFIAQHAGGGKAEQLFLRGFDNDHGTDVRISADGVPVNMVSHAHGQGYSDLHFLIPELISSIDYGKGSYYADKGDFNTSGFVDFHTKTLVEQSLVKIEGGSFNTVRMVGIFDLLNNERKKQYAYVGSEYNFTNGPFEVNQRFNRLNLFGKYTGRISDNTTIKFQVSTFSSNWNASGQIPERAVKSGIIGRFGSIDTTEGGGTSRTNISMGIHRHWRNRDLNSLFYYSKYRFNLYSDFTFNLIHPDKGDEIKQTDDRDIYGFDHSFTVHMPLSSSEIVWKSGVGMRYDNIHNLELSYVTQRDSLNERLAWGSGTEVNLNAYSSLEWKVNKFTFLPGIRIDWFSFNYFDKLQSSRGQQGTLGFKISPKMSLFFDPNRNIKLFIKSGIGFHSNDMRAAIARNGKEVLPSLFNTDLGANFKPLSGLYISPILWYSHLNSEFVWNGDVNGVSDAGATRRFGADLSVRYQPFVWLYMDVDANYAHARLIDAPKGQNYVELAPVFTSTGGISVLSSNGFSANIRYRYMKNRPANEDNSIKASGYFVNDLLVGYDTKCWGVNLQIQNMFNIDWNEAMFAETTRIKGEPASGINELTFTPGSPVFFKLGLTAKF